MPTPRKTEASKQKVLTQKRKAHNSAGTQVHVLLPEKPAHCLLQDEGLSPRLHPLLKRPGYRSHTQSFSHPSMLPGEQVKKTETQG